MRRVYSFFFLALLLFLPHGQAETLGNVTDCKGTTPQVCPPGWKYHIFNRNCHHAANACAPTNKGGGVVRCQNYGVGVVEAFVDHTVNWRREGNSICLWEPQDENGASSKCCFPAKFTADRQLVAPNMNKFGAARSCAEKFCPKEFYSPVCLPPDMKVAESSASSCHEMFGNNRKVCNSCSNTTGNLWGSKNEEMTPSHFEGCPSPMKERKKYISSCLNACAKKSKS